MEKLIIKDKKMICYLPSDQTSKFYYSGEFAGLMQWIAKNPSKCKVRENKGKLAVIIDSVDSIHDALDILHSISLFLQQRREVQ
jgi:transcription-repair coupling factor (superfamily II helicase)